MKFDGLSSWAKEQADAFAQGQAGVDAQAAQRAQRVEQAAVRPPAGSTALERAGKDPTYLPGYGRGSNQNVGSTALTSDDKWKEAFPTRANAFAPASKIPWTGPSLLPHAGPGSAAPFVPGQQGTNFVVPKPLTGPQGNAQSDAANLAANMAMAQPGGASGFWQQPQAAPDPGTPYSNVLSAAGTGQNLKTPYGDISSSTAPPATGAFNAQNTPFKAVDWDKQAKPDEEEPTKTSAPQMDAFA